MPFLWVRSHGGKTCLFIHAASNSFKMFAPTSVYEEDVEAFEKLESVKIEFNRYFLKLNEGGQFLSPR